MFKQNYETKKKKNAKDMADNSGSETHSDAEI